MISGASWRQLERAIYRCPTGRKMRFTGTTVLRVENGKIAEEVGLDDGVTALQQLGLLKAAWREWAGLGIVLGPSFRGKRCLMADPEAIYNWQRLDNRTTTSDQPTEKQLADIHALGVRHIVNLGLPRRLTLAA
jgi:hypothetical protein